MSSIKGDAFEFSPKTTKDETLNDSDKTFTVPAGKLWKLRLVHVNFASTATVGNRVMTLIVTDPSPTYKIFLTITMGTQAASLTYNYYFAKDAAQDVTGAEQSWPLPDFTMGPGWVLKLYDAAVIDAAADDMKCYILYSEVDG